MKKLILCFLILLSINVNASTNTYERTEEDLRVNDWVSVTNSNKYNILNTPSVDETEKIYDFADLLTDYEENNLYKLANEFINLYNMDLALVTIDDNYSTAQVYADDFYDYNNFGVGEIRSGLLVLIDMDTREFYISTTGEAILMYNDYRIDSILDDMTNSMIRGYYYQAFQISIESLSEFAEAGIPEGNKNSYIDDNGNYVYVENKEFPILEFIVVSAIGATIILVIFISKNKLVKKAYAASSYLDENNKIINNLGDVFLTTHTSSYRIESSSNSGSSGRSSTHRSSSGSSHGGGGRRF